MHASIQEKDEAAPPELPARTIDGLHEGLSTVLRRYLPSPAWAARLKALGYQAVAVERDAASSRFSGAARSSPGHSPP